MLLMMLLLAVARRGWRGACGVFIAGSCCSLNFPCKAPGLWDLVKVGDGQVDALFLAPLGGAEPQCCPSALLAPAGASV